MPGAGAGSGGGSAGGVPEGERVIAASRRPDGTMRKEIRIRAGYIPQDEVEKYAARGTQPRCDSSGVPPGMDPEYAAQQMAAKKKSAKKNEKRKEKKAAATAPAAPEHGGAEGLVGDLSGLSVGATTTVNASLSGSSSCRASSKPSSEAPKGTERGGAAPQEEGNPEKQLRNLRKKVRQAEALEAAIASRGTPATPEEQEKVSKLTTWRQEVTRLEKEVS